MHFKLYIKLYICSSIINFIEDMFNLILFGPPGSGKGTQGELLMKKYNLIHLSTGNLLREEIANQTTLGLEAKQFMDKGKLVPDAVVIGMIDSMIDKYPDTSGFLFDGFPRTVTQAQALDSLLLQKDAAINLVLALQVPEEILVQRLLHRGKSSGRSDDMDEQVIRERIQEYEYKTAPVAEYYKKSNKIQPVLGEGNINDIFDALANAFESAQTNNSQWKIAKSNS
jgi:adenylate kinase